ncbi:MAG: diguanylate cyclase [Panacagrimonas sp.]
MNISAEVLSEFAKHLPWRVDELAGAIASDSQATARDHIRGLAHRLSGSALSYGFHDVGLASLRIEKLATDELLDDPSEAALMNVAMDRLRGAVAASSSRPAGLAPPSGEVARDRVGDKPVVMMVDDDAELLAFVCMHLKSLGFSAHGFADPEAALTAVNELQPQCLLLGIMFPGDDDAGFGLSEQLSAQLPTAPMVIFLTRRDDVHARRRAVAAGAHSFLRKPVNLSTLGTILEHQFSANRQSEPRVLLVEDSSSTARLYTLMLKRAGIESVTVQDPFQLLDTVYHFQPDLVLLDLNLPDVNGAELCELLRQHETLFDLPVMGLTGETDPVVLKRAMQAGMDGIVQKDEDLAGLIPLIRARVARYRRVRHSIMRDMLTGLMNRSALLERLSLELLRGHGASKPLALAIVDVDDFKRINDSYGHLVGDAALKHVAHHLKSRLRSVDFAGRLGGDEFLVVLPSTDIADAARVIEEVVGRVREAPFVHNGQEMTVTLSAGLVESDPNLDISTERGVISQLMARADGLMYEAKRQGRDRVVWAGSLEGRG